MIATGGLRRRAAMIRAIRQFFFDREYLEVETPLRIPAPAPEAHIEPVYSDGWCLQTSPELCMKRLLAAGIPKIFQICKCFRRNERGRLHLSEFTMLEWYRAGIDYKALMDECRDMVRFVAGCLGRQNTVFRGVGIDFSQEWDRLAVPDAFESFAGVTVDQALQDDSFDELLVAKVEPNLGTRRPLFLFDYPACFGALARLKEGDRNVAERFELYVNGLEIANGFSELTDPAEQRLRFEEERKVMQKKGIKLPPMPERFLDSLADMPQAAGIALGIDRLAMVFLGVEHIDNAIAFAPEEL